jgi:hypothetical protein
VNVVAKESRIGMKPVAVPKGVTIKLQGQQLTVKASDDWLLVKRTAAGLAAACSPLQLRLIGSWNCLVLHMTRLGQLKASALCGLWCAGAKGGAVLDIPARGHPQRGVSAVVYAVWQLLPLAALAAAQLGGHRLACAVAAVAAVTAAAVTAAAAAAFIVQSLCV